MLKQKTPLKRNSKLKAKTQLSSRTTLKTKSKLKSNTTLKAKTTLKSNTTLKTKTSLKSNSQLDCIKKLKSTAKLKIYNYKKTVKDGTLNLAFPKFARVRSQEVIEQCKLPYCEICGRDTNNEPHHIISRGAGGPDVPENLIQLCPICHTKAHSGEFSKEKQFSIVGRRLKLSIEEIDNKIKKLRGRL